MPSTTLPLHISHFSSRPHTDPPSSHIPARRHRQQANDMPTPSITPSNDQQTSPVASQWPSLKPTSLEALAPEAPEACDRTSGFVVQSTTGQVVSAVSIEEGVLDGGKEAIEEKEEGADNGKCWDYRQSSRMARPESRGGEEGRVAELSETDGVPETMN